MMHMRARRTLVQGLFLLVFVFGMLGFGHRLGVDLADPFFKSNPLIAVSLALGTRAVAGWMAWALVLMFATVLFGRFFCGWICPFGALHDLCGRFRRFCGIQKPPTPRGYHAAQGLKFVLLSLVLGLSVGGVSLLGWLDPVSLTARASALIVDPFRLVAGIGGSGVPVPVFRAGWVIGAWFVFLLGLNLLCPRFYCRMICPLGALLGLLASCAPFRIRRSQALCIDCNRCLAVCPGASDPQARLRKSECLVCRDCLAVCPKNALSYGLRPAAAPVDVLPDETRRRLLQGAGAALVAGVMFRLSARSDRLPGPGLIRPPGAGPERDFLARCLRCGRCMQACPTRVIQPAVAESGAEGLWTPVMVNRIGYCQYDCIRCGQVCPTGALRNFSLAEKQGRAGEVEPIRLGLAVVDHGRCLAWGMHQPCMACRHACPLEPKAIEADGVDLQDEDGFAYVLERPRVRAERCIGCGRCTYHCPVGHLAAIRVSAMGETR